jgi:uncharacterized protein (TIGR02466 family)
MFTTNQLFPTPVITCNIDRPFTKQEIDCVQYHKQHTYKNTANITSLNTSILKNNFPEVNKFIKTGIDYYVNNIICPDNELEFYVTQSWLNYTEPGQSHHKHAHLNSIISGVFYFHAEEGVDKIHFENDYYRQISIPAKQWNTFNSVSWWIPVKSGELVLFPSSLVHMVEPTKSHNTRISLSFNVFVRGMLGKEMGLTALIL